MTDAILLKDLIEKISYNKTQTYTKEEVIQEIANMGLVIEVSSLPTEDIEENKLYIIPNDTDEEGNKYSFFVYVDGDWEQIDKVNNIDYTDFPTRSELSYELSLKADTNHGHNNATTNSDGFMTSEDKTKLNNLENDYLQKSDTPGLVKNDGSIDSSFYLTSDDISDELNVNLTGYIPKSVTEGLMKNDGTVDTNTYLTSEDMGDILDVNFGYLDDELVIRFIKASVELNIVDSIIQKNGTANLNAVISDENDNLIEGVRVDFYEIYTPTLTLTSDKSIIQNGEQADLTVKLKDTDGNLVNKETIYFFEKTE